MREEIKIGDLVEWRACYTIKSCVKKIIPSRGNKNVMVYRLENNCEFFKNEIKKAKS